MDRWLRPLAAAGSGTARPDPGERGRRPLAALEQRDRDGGPPAIAAQARRGDRDRPRVPGGLGRPASGGDRAWRHQELQHHGEADGQREDHRHRFGPRARRHAPQPHLHAVVCSPRGARGPGKHAPFRSGQSRLRAHRDALGPAAIRGAAVLSRSARGQTVARPSAPADPAGRRHLQRTADELHPGHDRLRPGEAVSERRGCRPREGRRRELSPSTDRWRPGERI